MMKRGGKALLVLLFALMLASRGFAVEKGTLLMRVVDNEGAGLAGCSVTVSSPAMMGTRTLITDQFGAALFVNLDPGVYQAKVTLPGFQELISTGIQINIDKRADIQVELKPATLDESITVVATTPAVDPTKSVIAEHVTNLEVESAARGPRFRGLSAVGRRGERRPQFPGRRHAQ